MAIGDRVRELLRLRDEAGKFTKAESYYVDDSFQKPIRCGNCNFYDGVNNTCDIVSEKGPPGPGRISRQGACSLFNARPPRIQLLQHLWGRGGRRGMAPEVARASAFMVTYAALDEEPPPELREKAVVDPDTIKRLLPRR